MDATAGLLFLLVLGTGWVGNARNLASTSSAFDEIHQNENLCTLCETYVNTTLYYLKENETQTVIIEDLRSSCSQIPFFEEECILLVDYYASLLFSTIATIDPDEFCEKFNLCETFTTISKMAQQDSCDMCHQAIEEFLKKLKDPDTQLEITQVLLKACDSVEKHVKKCKKLVLRYVPEILNNADQFLEKTDLCTVVHACESAIIPSIAVVETKQASSSSSVAEMSLLSRA